jgi:hypothetical protein
MWVVGILVLIGMALYALFAAVDGAGLATHEGSATVLDKGYLAAGLTYYTQIIDNRPYVRTDIRPEMYLLKLRVDGGETTAVVPRETYEAFKPGDRVRAAYQRRRLTGALEVVRVSPE